MPTDVQNAIIRAAQDAGIDPSAALAIAERESSFNPNAHSSRTIHGIYQMTGGLRQQYGIGDSSDPETQARGWAIFFKDNKGEMARVLGRDPTDAEGYLGHHFGSVRAARMMRMDPNTPVDQVFSPYEMSVNPHFARAGTVGNLNASVTADITRRQAKFGGTEAPDLAEFGTPADGQEKVGQSDLKAKMPDLSMYGTVASQGPDPEPQPQPSAKVAALTPPNWSEGPYEDGERNPALQEPSFEPFKSGERPNDYINKPKPADPAPQRHEDANAPDLASFGTPA